MTRLEELIYSLTAVIVRYHDSQPKVKKLVNETDEELLREKSLIRAKEIIQNKDVHFNIRLNELIKQCNDSGRRPFLYYILHEITLLETLLNKKSSLEPAKLEECKNQIFQLLVDLKVLLETPKHKTYRMSYSQPEDTKERTIGLSGLKNDGYIGGELCNSGDILNDSVLKRFNISTQTSNARISDIAEQICTEHQHVLLVSELSEKNTALNKINSEQEQELDLLSTEHKDTQKKLENITAKERMAIYVFYIIFKRMQAKEEKQKTVIEQQQDTIGELRQQISELTHSGGTKSSNHRFYTPSY
ncbi:hypothetical protein [Legionella sp. WA2022007384]